MLYSRPRSGAAASPAAAPGLRAFSRGPARLRGVLAMFEHATDALALSLAPGRLRFTAVERLRALEPPAGPLALTARDAFALLVDDPADAGRLARRLSAAARRIALERALARGLRAVPFGHAPTIPRCWGGWPMRRPCCGCAGTRRCWACRPWPSWGLAPPARTACARRAAWLKTCRPRACWSVSGLARGIDAAAHHGRAGRGAHRGRARLRRRRALPGRALRVGGRSGRATAPCSPSSRRAPRPARTTSRCGTASSAASAWRRSWSRRPNGAARSSRPAPRSTRGAR